jgi:hypothetical protein
MVINYSGKEVIKGDKSIFLAGPTPRNKGSISWRPEALDILNKLDFSGIVYVPEYENGPGIVDDDKQFAWELEALEAAKVIAFWVPRKLPDMPAFTTNVEFGYWIRTGKVIYGRPDGAEHVGYLDRLYKFRTNNNPFHDLEQLLRQGISLCDIK